MNTKEQIPASATASSMVWIQLLNSYSLALLCLGSTLPDEKMDIFLSCSVPLSQL